jgi:PhnB protein
LDVPEDKQKKIMHAEFSFWGGNLMFSDLMDEANFTTPATASNIHLNLGFEDKNKMQETFDKLKQGGKVTTELEEQFWGDIFGMVQDKYGINWMCICPAEK